VSAHLCVVCQRADPYRPDLAAICPRCRGYIYDSLIRSDKSQNLTILRLFGHAISAKKADDARAERARNSIQQIDLCDPDAETT
jgi:hypothetical protein